MKKTKSGQNRSWSFSVKMKLESVKMVYNINIYLYYIIG